MGRIKQVGVPAGRGSTKFCLVSDGVHYPPKYVLALAARHVLGRELRPDEFSGGPQTNAVLTDLGFSVISCPCGGRREAGGGGSARERTPIVRVVCNGRPPGDPRAAERLLYELFTKRWPDGVHAEIVLTPGGFVQAGFPEHWSGGIGWDSRTSDLTQLVKVAEPVLRRVLSERLQGAARGKADVLTLGLDLWADSGSAELVAVCNLSSGEVSWTGKSYPTSSEERSLVQVIDLKTHVVEIGGERVLVLGCHDLNMFNRRGNANQAPDGQRRARCDAMRRVVERFKPTIILQHPHSTDTPNIWRQAWLALASKQTSVKAWASGIAYFARSGAPRKPLDRVLLLTKSEVGVRDVIFDTG